MLFMFLAYAALIACVAIIAMKFIGYLKHPQHLRWEIYPVAHEDADRVTYGGSYLEMRSIHHLGLDLRAKPVNDASHQLILAEEFYLIFFTIVHGEGLGEVVGHTEIKGSLYSGDVSNFQLVDTIHTVSSH